LFQYEARHEAENSRPTEVRTRQLTSFLRRGRGSRAEEEARHEVEILTPRQDGNLRLF